MFFQFQSRRLFSAIDSHLQAAGPARLPLFQRSSGGRAREELAPERTSADREKIKNAEM